MAKIRCNICNLEFANNDELFDHIDEVHATKKERWG